MEGSIQDREEAEDSDEAPAENPPENSDVAGESELSSPVACNTDESVLTLAHEDVVKEASLDLFDEGAFGPPINLENVEVKGLLTGSDLASDPEEADVDREERSAPWSEHAVVPSVAPDFVAAEAVDAPKKADGDLAKKAIHQPRFRYHDLLGGKYRLEKSIARGGMGWVFLATQLPLGREVAIKVVMPQPGDTAFRRRFLLEASTCAKLVHPNIVTIHDYGQTPAGDVFMVMEYLRGRSLSETIAREKRIDAERACRILVQVLRALRAAHRAGIVHRDLKPSNVMLLENTDEGSGLDFVKVVDFGLAKPFVVTDGSGAIRLTQAGMLLGSPRYMAPEQIRNRAVDPRTDVYAVGIISFYMVTGRHPFDGDNPTEILTQHLRDPVPSTASVDPHLDVPPEFEDIIQRCLEKDPSRRYQTIEDLLADVKAIYLHLADLSPSSALFTKEWSTGLPRSDFRRMTGSARVRLSAIHSGEHDSEQINSGVTTMMDGGDPPLSPRSTSFGNGWWALAVILFAIVSTLAFWAVILS